MMTGSLYASGSMTARVITFAHKQAAAARDAGAGSSATGSGC
jgi:hypothetical protein